MPVCSEARRPRLTAAFILDRLGQLTLPAAAGVVAGYWIADRGVRWTPTVLGWVALAGAVALLAIFAGQWLRGRVVTETAATVRVRRRTVVLLGLAVLAASVHLLAHRLARPAPLTRLGRPELNQSFRLDGAQLVALTAQMEHLVARVAASEVASAGARHRPLTSSEEELLRDAWAAFYRNAFALEQIRIFYEDWYRFDPSWHERPLLLRSYLLSYAAELALYEKGLRLVDLLAERDEVKTFLDAPHASEDLPANTFSTFRQEFLGVRDEARVIAGERYLRFLDTTLDAHGMALEIGAEALWQEVEAHLAALSKAGHLQRAEHTVRADLQLLKRSVRRTWFPAQTAVANWMGDVKTRRVGRYLISEEQAEELDGVLAPGDILVARKNWYLSNVGLPGFWPHAILYIGDPAELRATFDLPEVRAWLGGSLEEHLANRYPAAWASYLAGLDGHPITVIEAVGEGVVLNSLAHVTGDYCAAMRPRLAPLARAQAVVAAFSHLGKPYDFDFDFSTEHTLVCTELVWRSYRPGPDQAGLELPVRRVAGRLTLPANDIVRLYADEHDRADRQLDFVAFIDGREQEGRAVPADEAAFRESWRRPKWDVAQD